MYERDSTETACRECGILVHLPQHIDIFSYRCPRCRALLYRRGQPFGYVIVMAITALALYLPLSFLPILDLKILGLESKATLFEAIWKLYELGDVFIGVMALMTGMLIPAVMLVILLAILVPLHLGFRPKKISLFYRLYEKLSEWGMAEVYLISIVVAIVKLSGMGTLHIGPGFYLFIFFFLTFYITTVWFNPDDIWLDDALDH